MKKKIQDVIQQEFKGLWGTDFSEDGIPVIKTNNMTYEGRIDFSDICKRNVSFEEASPNFLQKGDLIIEKSGGTKTHSVGYVNIFEGEDNKYICNNFILPLRPNKELVDCKYLFWQLHGMYEAGKFADCYNKTTGIQNLQKKSYFAKEINVPSKEEQQKIAAELDTIQSAIDNKKQQLSLLDEAVKSEFVEMFGENPVESGKWKVEKLSNVSKTSGAYGAQSASCEYDDNRPRYIRITDINDDGSLNNDFVCSDREEDDTNYKLEYGDFLFARMGATVGKTYAYDEGNMIFAGYLIRFQLDCEKLLPTYLFYFTKTEWYNIWVKDNQSGAAQPGINAKKYGDLPIPVPPLDLQNTFATFVQQIDKSKFVVKQQIADLQELLDSKMQEYFS